MYGASEISPGGTLIGDWRRKLATRGALVAALVAVPVAAAAMIGLGGGAGGLAGISSLIGGPSELATGIPAAGSAPAQRLARLAGTEAAVPSAAPLVARTGTGESSTGTLSTGIDTGGGAGVGAPAGQAQQAGRSSGLGQGLADTTRPLTGGLGSVGGLLQGTVDAVGSVLDALLNPPPSR